MTPSPSPVRRFGEPRRPASAQTMADHNLSRRFQLQVSECVETKTVTTTTRLTRKFPHVFVRDPTPLERLDSKEYPLAMKPTPPELLGFSYNMPDDDAQHYDNDHHDDDDDDHDQEHDPKSMHRLASGNMTPTAVRFEPVAHRHSPTSLDGPRRATRSPSQVCPRRTRQTRAGLAESLNTTFSADGAAAAPVSHFFKSIPNKPLRGLGRSSNLHAVSDKLLRSVQTEAACSSGSRTGSASSSSRRDMADRLVRGAASVLATPDTSELPGPSSSSQRSSRRRLLHLEPLQSSPADSVPTLSQSQSALCDAAVSPSGSDSLTTFSSIVATPPITDADAAPFGDADVDESLQQSVRSLHHRPAIDVVAAQDASLPSPRLSPTLAASQPPSADHDDDATASFRTAMDDPGSVWIDDSEAKQEADAADADRSYRELGDLYMAKSGLGDASPSPVVVDPQTLIEAFDSMRPEMKTFMMYQFLRRCPRPTLRVIADAVNPALKCDFLQQLPLELAYHVISYVDCRDLCRAAQVSKHWRNIVDRNETGWKELFDRQGFTLPTGELQKAIAQGWGWQDPVGVTGYEKDLSMLKRLTASETELTRNSRLDAPPKLRTSKRKRGLNTYSATERSKRRAAAAQGSPASREPTTPDQVKLSKSEGPLTAANDAAAAIPDPQIGLPSLRQLHLFKSLYRRHHMIRRSWTSGEVRPSHVAFAAHPRHVITCLQFDDDKIITGSDDTLIHIYDTKTGTLRKRLEGHEGGVWALQYEGNILVSGSTDRSVRVWDIERGLCQQVFYGHTSTVRCLQILMPTETGRDAAGRAVMQPEQPLIITGSRDSQLRVWRLPLPGSRRYIQTHPPAQESDCPYFIRVLTGHTHSVRAISAHGDNLVSGSYDSSVRVWRISTGDALHVLRGHSQKVYSVVLDHERNRCISGSMDSLVKIWDLTTGACLHTLEGHSLLVGLLDLRDERLVSAAADSTLRIWDPETGRCRHTLMAHTGAITCFQHDGRKVISGSEKTVKMWDVQTGECVQDLLTDLSGVWQVKFDGRRCVAAVQRDQLTYVEILDFGAIRDGQPPENLGKRILLNEHEVREIVDDSLT